MTFARIVEVPVPLAAAAFQAVPGVDTGNAGWLTGALFGVWLVLWFLDRIGKLPGRPNGGMHLGFRPEDKAKLDEVHGLLATRDEAGETRFGRHVRETHMAVERQKDYIATQDRLERLMERQATISAQHNQLVGLLTDQLRIMGSRLDTLERHNPFRPQHPMDEEDIA